MIDLSHIERDVLAECQDDHVGLWSIIWKIRYTINRGTFPSPEEDQADPDVVRRVTMEMVRTLLNSGDIQAGFPTADGKSFRPWHLGAEEVVSRIQAEWNALGQEPNMGEVVWFTSVETPEARDAVFYSANA